jgi:hypothetical protein
VTEAEREDDGAEGAQEPAREDAAEMDDDSAGASGDDELARIIAEAERELPELPPPPQWQRKLTLAVMGVTALVCGLLAWSLRGDAIYALQGGGPLELGDLRVAELSPGIANRYVRGYAHLESSPAVHYARRADPDRYQLLPVAGAPEVWVEHRVPRGLDGPRFTAPSRVSGRLVPLDDLGIRHRGVADAVARAGVPDGGGHRWLLLEGVDPQSERWALALALMLAAFAAWNVWGIARILRRFRPVGGPAPSSA